MAEQQVCITGVACGATCSLHGAITITFNTGATGFDSNGHTIVRVGDTGTPSCNVGQTATATTGSSIVNIAGNAIHRVGDAGTTPHGTYVITSVPTPIFFAS